MLESSSQRKRSHDAAGARTAILNTAEIVFAQHGFDGARIDAIAAQAGYNKSLIFQYFGDKLNLYAQILKRADRQANELRTRVFAPLVENENIASDAQQLKAFFEEAFQAIFDYLLVHPRLIRILFWEMAEGWQTYTQISSQLQIEQVEPIELLFQKAHQAGLLQSTFSPALQLTLALQICQSYFASLPLYQALLPNQDLSSAALLTEARQYIVATIVAGIMVDPPRHS